MALLDPLFEELEKAQTSESMTLGSQVLAAVGESVLKNMGFPVSTKATVRFLIDDTTSIVIDWPEEEDDESWRLT